MIRAKVRDWIEHHDLLPWGGNVLAACSGGADSLALVDLLAEFNCEGAIRLFVAHFDHGLRGEASKRDAEFVRQFCAERALPFFGGFADVRETIRTAGGSLEEVARHLRYDYLCRVLAQVGGGLIATGHHKDDQAETVLLNLIRGSGGRGLAAMKIRRNDIVRPLLCLTRSEIDRYCHERNLQPRTDESNCNVEHYRNRVRHELIPLLQKRFNPALTETLCRTAEILADSQQFVHQYVTERLPGWAVHTETGYRLDAAAFSGLPVAVQRELLLVLLEQIRGDTRRISFTHIEQIRQLFLQDHGARRIDLPGAWQARKSYQDLYVEAVPGPIVIDRKSCVNEPARTVIACPGETFLPEFGVMVRCSLHAKELCPPVDLGADKVAFDVAALQFPLYARQRTPGDVFQPLGAAGARKLKKLLIDLKVPLAQRDTLPLIIDSQGILWVMGLRRAERGRLQESTREIIVIEQIKTANID
jgi:tRNA(Ile)-lysidine synthase